MPPASPHKFPLPQAVAFGVIMLPSFAAAVLLRNAEFGFYAVVTTLLALGVWAMHRRVGFTGALLWLLVAWAALHMIGGLVPVPAWLPAREPRVFYNLWVVPPKWLKYDQVVHAFGFGVTAWAVWQGLRSMFPTARPTWGVLLICGTAAMGFGALNEVVEFAAVLAVGETNVGGYENTLWDLVSNTVGALAACVLIRLATGPAH